MSSEHSFLNKKHSFIGLDNNWYVGHLDSMEWNCGLYTLFHKIFSYSISQIQRRTHSNTPIMSILKLLIRGAQHFSTRKQDIKWIHISEKSATTF